MQRPRLLLADDSLTIQRVVNLTFADEGIDVVTVGDGDAALREIAKTQPDIVLADVHMPGPNGYEICSLLRGIEETAKTPVILLVGSFEQFDPEEADRVGANAFVTKPFQSIRELVDQVKELVADQDEHPNEISADSISETPAVPEADTTDIDSLYHRSFAETIEMPADMAAEMAAASVRSDRLDDEMIETSYLAEQPNEQIDRGPVQNEALFSEVSEGSDQIFEEQPLTAEVVSQDPGVSYYETIQMDDPAPNVGNTDSDASVHTAPTEELRRDPFATTTDAFDLDDIDLLDLSSTSATEEFTFATPTEARDQGSNKQVVSISPELMDIIVKKVVEKLSEKY